MSPNIEGPRLEGDGAGLDAETMPISIGFVRPMVTAETLSANPSIDESTKKAMQMKIRGHSDFVPADRSLCATLKDGFLCIREDLFNAINASKLDILGSAWDLALYAVSQPSAVAEYLPGWTADEVMTASQVLCESVLDLPVPKAGLVDFAFGAVIPQLPGADQ